MEPTALFDDGAIVAFIDLVGTFGVGGGAAFHDFVEPYEVGLLHGGFQLVAGLEVDVHRLHVAGREGFFCVGSLGAEGDVKGSPVAQLHAFAVEQETLHHLAQLADSHLRFHRIESSIVGTSLSPTSLVVYCTGYHFIGSFGFTGLRRCTGFRKILMVIVVFEMNSKNMIVRSHYANNPEASGGSALGNFRIILDL